MITLRKRERETGGEETEREREGEGEEKRGGINHLFALYPKSTSQIRHRLSTTINLLHTASPSFPL